MAETKERSTGSNRLFIEDRTAPGIGGFAGGEQLHLTKETTATGNHERNHHPVTRRHGSDLRADFFDDPHELMAENIAVFSGGNLAAIQVQVRTADSRRRDSQQDIVGLLNDGVRNGFDPNVMGTVISE